MERYRHISFKWNTDIDLPALPGPNHNGGKLVVESENMHLYAVIGDLNRKGTFQNFKNDSLPDDTSAIIRTNPDGSPAQDNPFLNVATISFYYAVVVYLIKTHITNIVGNTRLHAKESLIYNRLLSLLFFEGFLRDSSGLPESN
jgi:Glucose / Sorbosone dehydrogenase